MCSRISAACFLVIPALSAIAAAIWDLESAFAIFYLIVFIIWLCSQSLATCALLSPEKHSRKDNFWKNITFFQCLQGFGRGRLSASTSGVDNFLVTRR